ncbi:uncharacterized protein [Drosophila tropicalis]|uniref:uncharacterized protein n=1 Tax=Drosophila tropicalis TaxID=46794 RepID=UPI0035AC1E7E
MIKETTNRNRSKFDPIVDPVMEIFRQVQGRGTDESLENLLSFLDNHVESKSSDKEYDHDDGEGSFYSRSLSFGNGLGLNPFAEVFVPTYLKSNLNKPEAGQPDTKSEATSTTSLENDDDEKDNDNDNDNGVADDQEDTFNIQHQIFEFLSQMGDEKLSLDAMKITLLPGGHGINIQFTTDQPELSMPGKSISAEDLKESKSFKEHLCRKTALNLDITDQKIENKPENVLVAQFLQRASELLSEKYEWNASNSAKCPKCSIIWANRSYTEAEIEQQIECIKSFEKFISLTDSVKFQDLSSHKEFKELCYQLGLITDNDQVNLSEPQPSTTPTTEEKVVAEEEDPQGITEYVCGKIYRYDDSNGDSTLVNQMVDDRDDDIHGVIESELLIYNGDQPGIDAPPTTPAISMTITGLASPSKLRKSPRTKLSTRLQTCSSNNGPPRKNGKLQNEKINLNIQKMRISKVTGIASTKPKSQLSALYPSGKKASTIQHATLPRSSGIPPPILTAMTGRRQDSARLATAFTSGKQQTPSSSTSYGAKTKKVNSTKSFVAPVQKMVPRSTNASLMRQTAVKRRLNMLRGESDSDVLLHEYLFK